MCRHRLQASADQRATLLEALPITGMSATGPVADRPLRGSAPALSYREIPSVDAAATPRTEGIAPFPAGPS
jgi:hypothetical protein